MGYRYIVKSYRWENGIIQTNELEFASENEAISYSKSIGPAETIKIYVEDEVIYSTVAQPVVSYA
jgi:hypothetical protein